MTEFLIQVIFKVGGTAAPSSHRRVVLVAIGSASSQRSAPTWVLWGHSALCSPVLAAVFGLATASGRGGPAGA